MATPRFASTQFMQALPGAVRPLVPPELRRFKSSVRGWLCQLHYTDPRLHYEVWNMGERRGLIEIGLHFESRNAAENRDLLMGFSRRMVEVKAELGEQWEAEMWDKGWTKVYETVPYASFTEELLAAIAARLARAIIVLQPIWDEL